MCFLSQQSKICDYIDKTLKIIGKIMATAVASRFAVLSIDDDDDFSSKSKKQPKKKDDSKAKPGTSQQKAAGADLKKKNKTKKKAEVSNFVSDSYEQDLHEAVLQSKLEFEQQKKLMAEAGGQPPGGKGSKKKSKPQTISLEQFNNPKKEEEPPELDKEELSKEERLFFEQMDLQSVRERNAKLCSMLQEGEMKDKAKVLVEMERLQVMRQELVTEVQVLYAQLEQERSKVHALTSAADNSKKTKGKKKTVSECGQ
ncbi:hypothetical protein B566_EDAN012315 [Ephemera danica]|nr:hypothetical protein B566_EDAN012315 [Ephemera danica]